MNPAFFSPLPTFFSLSHAPAPRIFFCPGVSAVFSKVWIKMETRRVKRQNGEKCLTTGGWWHRMWECSEERVVASLLSSNHRRHCEDKPSKVSALTGNISDQITTLQNKWRILSFPSFVTSVQLLLMDKQFRQIQAHVSAQRKYYKSVALNA